MIWKISGADATSGRDVELSIDAPDEARARAAAKAQNILVSSINGRAVPRPAHQPPAISPALSDAMTSAATVVNFAGKVLTSMAVVVGLGSVILVVAAVGTSNIDFGIAAVAGMALAAALASWAGFSRFVVAWAMSRRN